MPYSETNFTCNGTYIDHRVTNTYPSHTCPLPNLCLLLLQTHPEHILPIGNNRKIEQLCIAFIVAVPITAIVNL